MEKNLAFVILEDFIGKAESAIQNMPDSSKNQLEKQFKIKFQDTIPMYQSTWAGGEGKTLNYPPIGWKGCISLESGNRQWNYYFSAKIITMKQLAH